MVSSFPSYRGSMECAGPVSPEDTWEGRNHAPVHRSSSPPTSQCTQAQPATQAPDRHPPPAAAPGQHLCGAPHPLALRPTSQSQSQTREPYQPVLPPPRPFARTAFHHRSASVPQRGLKTTRSWPPAGPCGNLQGAPVGVRSEGAAAAGPAGSGVTVLGLLAVGSQCLKGLGEPVLVPVWEADLGWGTGRVARGFQGA